MYKLSDTIRANVIQQQLEYILDCIVSLENLDADDKLSDISELIVHAKLLTGSN